MTRQELDARVADRHRAFSSRIAGRYAFAQGPVPSARMKLRIGRGILLLRLQPAVRLSTRVNLTLAATTGLIWQLRTKLVPQPERFRRALPMATWSHLPPSLATAARDQAQLYRVASSVFSRSEQTIWLPAARSTGSQIRFIYPLAPTPGAAVSLSAVSPLRDVPAVSPRREMLIPPLPRSLARPADQPLAAAVGRLETAVGRLVSDARQECWKPGFERSGPLVPADSKRIADEVLQTLDYRVMAMRERMGRR